MRNIDLGAKIYRRPGEIRGALVYCLYRFLWKHAWIGKIHHLASFWSNLNNHLSPLDFGGHYQRFLRRFYLDEVVPGRYSGKRRENQIFVYPRMFTNTEIPISQVDNYGLKPGRIIRVFYATQTSCESGSIIFIFNMSNEVARTGQILQKKILAFSLEIRRYPRYSIELESLEKTQNETPCVLGDLHWFYHFEFFPAPRGCHCRKCLILSCNEA